MGLLRLLLAVSVLFAHTGGLFGYRITGGSVAVQAFFIISGYLMHLVLDRKYDPLTQKGTFYLNRALRIYPTYLAALVFAFILAAASLPKGGGFLPLVAEAFGTLRPHQIAALVLSWLTIIGQDAYLYVSPSADGLAWGGGVDPAVVNLQPLPPAWSISLELMFYLIAPFLVRLSTRWLAGIVLVSTALRIAAAVMGYDGDPWSYRFFPFELAFFLLGFLSYRHRAWLTAGLLSRLWMLALAGTLVVQPAQFAAKAIGLPPEVISYPYLVVIAFSIPSLVAWSRGRKWDASLAEMSYPLYLFHWPIVALNGVYVPGGEATVRSIVCLVASLLIAWLAVALLERPLQRARDRVRSGFVKSVAEAGTA